MPFFNKTTPDQWKHFIYYLWVQSHYVSFSFIDPEEPKWHHLLPEVAELSEWQNQHVSRQIQCIIHNSIRKKKKIEGTISPVTVIYKISVLRVKSLWTHHLWDEFSSVSLGLPGKTQKWRMPGTPALGLCVTSRVSESSFSVTSNPRNLWISCIFLKPQDHCPSL